MNDPLPLAHPFAERVVRRRRLLLIAALVLAAWAWPAARKLHFDRSIENMFPADDPILRDFRHFQRCFGADPLILLVYRDESLLSPDGAGLRRSSTITAMLQAIPGVRDVLSLSVVDRMLQGLGTTILDADDPLARRYRELFAGYTHDTSGRVGAVACLLKSDAGIPGGLRATIEELRAAARHLPEGLAAGVLVGEAVMVHDSFEYVEQDARRLNWLSLLLLGAILLLTLRSLRWVCIALLVVQWTLLVTQGLLYGSGLRLSMVSSMLAAVVTVIGVATVMHLAVAIRDRQARGLLPHTAVVHTLSWLGPPIFWACVTDAAGFLALRAAQATPVRDFGLMMATGALVVLAAIGLLVPGLALALSRETVHPRPRGARRLERGLMRIVRVVRRRPRSMAVLVAALSATAWLGSRRLQVETDFTRNFREGSSVADAYEFVESNLGGAGVWDILLPAPDILNQPYLQRVLDLETQLRGLKEPGTDRPALTKVLSLADLLDAARERKWLAVMPVELRAQGMRHVLPTFFATLRGRNPDSGTGTLRIMLRAFDRRDAETKQWLIAEVTRLAREAFPDQPGREPVRVTGYYVLLTELVAGMLRDQWRCFLAAIVGVGLVLLIALRSAVAATQSLITNALPILLTLGAIGWIGLRMNMGTAMIAAVSMGLSVDSSLHYLFAYQRARRAGRSRDESLIAAQQTVGRALVLATVALAVGFLALCASDFVPTIYFGALGGITLVGGLVGNLLVLPWLVGMIDRPASGRTRDRAGPLQDDEEM